MSDSPIKVVAAIHEVALALKAAGKTRDEADASLRVTAHVDYHGHVTDVLDEVYGPALVPLIDLPSYHATYEAIEVPEFGFEDRDEAAEYEQAEARAGLAETVSEAIRLLAADLHATAVRTRPTTSEANWQREDEEADNVADVYDETATRLLQVFGLAGATS